jgi:hypothetical protein
MPATRVECKQPPISCRNHDFRSIEEEEEMTRMQRFQPWLMAGIALFGLSAAVMGLALNAGISLRWLQFYQRVSFSVLAIGAISIITGTFVELLIPGFVWRFGARGHLYRALRAQIKVGRQIDIRPTGDWQTQRQWAQGVVAILENDKGSWQPEIEELLRLGDQYHGRSANRPLVAHEILARQIRSIEQFAARLYRGEV